MPRFSIIVQYDGTAFRGWQLQKHDRTIQGELEKSLIKFNNNIMIRVYGAGRTDTGVHATGQVAHFDLKTNLEPIELKNALNGHLPKDIRIMNCNLVSEKFHARFSAIKRFYLYRIRNDNFLLDRNFTWSTEKLDIVRLNDAAKIIKGNHDFTSFSRNNKNLEHRRCIIYESLWKEDNEIVNYYITGNRFLHHMVRYLVGTMVEVSRKKIRFEKFKELIENPSENAKIFKAPPQGLVLYKVDYANN